MWKSKPCLRLWHTIIQPLRYQPGWTTMHERCNSSLSSWAVLNKIIAGTTNIHHEG